METTLTSRERPGEKRFAARGRLVGATLTLWRREMVRFVRQRNRLIGALVTPIVFWLLLGSGLNQSFAVEGAGSPSAGGMGYLEYFFPGTVVLILLFAAIFSTISVIEERREGFLQAVLAAPAPRLALVLGKVFGGATIATGQAAVFVLLWPLVGRFPGIGHVLLAIGVMFILALGLTGLGLCIAWPMDSTVGFHAVMNLFLMPMWFLCGAVFPLATAAGWMRPLMLADPLTYGYSTLAATLHGSATPASALSLTAAGTGMVTFSVLMILLAVWMVMGKGAVQAVKQRIRPG